MSRAWHRVAIALVALCLWEFFPLPGHGREVQLRLDIPSPTDTQLKNFRRADGPFVRKAELLPSRVGLEDLKISGSAQFSVEELRELKTKRIGQNFVDVDLRQESHGYFNALPVSWYAKKDWINRGKTLEEIISDETQRLQEGLRAGKGMAHYIHTEDGKLEETSYVLPVTSVATEDQIAHRKGLRYFRIPVTDHLKPSAADVNRFLEFYRKLPPDTWIHFHCEGGVGRTTTFMAMTDMLRNAKAVSFEAILERQWLLGGMNLAEFPDQPDWKYQGALARKEFLRKFYQYARDDMTQAWTE